MQICGSQLTVRARHAPSISIRVTCLTFIWPCGSWFVPLPSCCNESDNSWPVSILKDQSIRRVSVPVPTNPVVPFTASVAVVPCDRTWMIVCPPFSVTSTTSCWQRISPEAQALGVQPGATLASARALCAALRSRVSAPAGERAARDALLDVALSVSPRVREIDPLSGLAALETLLNVDASEQRAHAQPWSRAGPDSRGVPALRGLRRVQPWIGRTMGETMAQRAVLWRGFWLLRRRGEPAA